MTTGTGAEDPELANDSDVFSVTTYGAPSLQRREFLPWHKPRKQWIRAHQWAPELQWLLGERSDGNADVRYLGLPGADLLDLRDMLERFDWPPGTLTFLGFDRGASPGSSQRQLLNVALTEVRANAAVAQESDVIGDDLSLLANKDSVAYSRAKRIGTFDVLNIDLCGSAATETPGDAASLFATLQSLFGLQQRHPREWVLLLTTRVNRQRFNADLLTRLIELISGNMRASARFAREVEDELHLTLPTAEATTVSDSDFLHTVELGLSKWLLGLAVAARNSFSIGSVVGYRVYTHNDTPDMISLAFRLRPDASLGPDRAAIARAIDPLEPEVSQACELPGALARMIDVDVLLRDNLDSRAAAVEEAEALLERAHYDPAAYREWVALHGFAAVPVPE